MKGFPSRLDSEILRTLLKHIGLRKPVTFPPLLCRCLLGARCLLVHDWRTEVGQPSLGEIRLLNGDIQSLRKPLNCIGNPEICEFAIAAIL